MLAPHADGWNIVLSGHWDALIFSPDWARAHLADGAEVTVEMPRVASLPPRLSFGGLALVVVDHKLLLTAREATEETLKRMQAVATKSLELLPHTPTVATGINFALIEKEPGPLADILKLGDADALRKGGWTQKGCSVRRQLLQGDRAVNLTIEARDDGSTLIAVNHHFDTRSTTTAAEALGQGVVARWQETRELLQATYGLGVAL